MSARDFAAFSNIAGFEPGTANSERCRRGRACSIKVKLIRYFPFNRFRSVCA